ncbi:hypothetical protein CUJ84_pRLN2000253 (plasmid) [Rhizobium leguminosarum]|uniref:Uncharacterized protein n=1 Tax=Rhizobium leguminosarum TaxID=384 RepID=A0A2K9ZEV6_RHILE|nr:hypothetical protein CUJ84_pRLN2000253 [Rhizobium leguminosarum]
MGCQPWAWRWSLTNRGGLHKLSRASFLPVLLNPTQVESAMAVRLSHALRAFAPELRAEVV